jgi:tryptophan synthase alpha subunit
VVAGIRGTNSKLEKIFDDLLKEAQQCSNQTLILGLGIEFASDR